MKLKVEFNKYRKEGQNFFSRSLPMSSLEILLIICDELRVEHLPKKKTAEIIFIFNGELNRFAKAKNVPLWIAKKFLPETEWNQHIISKPRSK
jgi:hypothetical protein